MELFIPLTLNCILVLLIYALDKSLSLKNMPYKAKQIAIGIIFGILSAFSSEFGVDWLGTVINMRDAAPITAGLIFGAPAGIISGFIGGIYRLVSVLWGAGTYTVIACTLATILSGFIAAAVRKKMFDDKKPTWGYGICITVVCEVIHMLLIFLTNMDDSSRAFEFVKGASVPMILFNALAVGLSIIIVSFLSNEGLIRKKENEQIAQTFQRWLLACIVIAFVATASFTYVLQNGMASIKTKEMFKTAIDDVVLDVRGKSDDYLLKIAKEVAIKYERNPRVDLSYLAINNNVVEINIIAKDGLITNSTDKSLVGKFNMNDTEQSRVFMMLTGEQKTYVQEYGPVGSDGKTMRKFAGLTLSNGDIIQVGYSKKQFQTNLNQFVIDVTKNRHVSSGGFIAVCDEQLKLVTDGDLNGEHISAIGIIPDENMLNGLPSSDLCKASVSGPESKSKTEYIYVYTFVEGYCIIAAMPEVEAMFMRDTSFYTSMFMQVLIFATLFVFIYVLIKKVIINNLKKINDSLAQITEGDLSVEVNVRSNKEFSSLSDDINSTVATLKRYIAEAAARIDKELGYAKQIQLSALPVDFSDNEDMSIYAEMIAAKEVGGDFYDFYKLNDTTVAFLAADVSGKGIPAAMFMMTAKTIIKDLAESGLSVNEIFTKANEKLCENNESGMFVTAWMGILDLTSGKLLYANAGHNPPLLKRAKGSFEYLRTRAGFVLAGMEGIRYRVNELTLEPGDRLFLYTDGVTEATNEENKLYGEERLINFMNLKSALKATELLPALKSNIDEFVGAAPQFDDITMLMFDYKPVKDNSLKVNKVFPAEDNALNDVLMFIEENLEAFGCPMKTINAICVAIEEMFVNVSHYAYGEAKGEVEFILSFDENSREAAFIMSDSGVPFDPLKRTDPDITLPASEREIGGLGIFIAKKTMDSINYSYENGKNILTMIKKI